jgi:hypothetical protein
MNTPATITRDPDEIMPRSPGDMPTQLAPFSSLTPMGMLDRAVSQGAGIDILTKLMELQERYDRNLARKAFDNAMAAAKAEMPVINKNREVDYTSSKGRTNYRHEDLAEIARTVDPILAKQGLSYRFRTETPINGPVIVTCIVSHRDGYSEENSLSAGRDDTGNKNSLQAMGSAITYLQRYALKASLGLAASNDDDGRAAGGYGQRPVTEARKAPVEIAAPAPPDHDPVTGETGPRVIALPQNDNVNDWVKWGQQLIAGIKAAENGAEVDEWHSLNAERLGEAMKTAPKVYGSVGRALQAAIVRFATPAAPATTETPRLPAKESFLLRKALVKKLADCQTLAQVEAWRETSAEGIASLQDEDRVGVEEWAATRREQLTEVAETVGT